MLNISTILNILCVLCQFDAYLGMRASRFADNSLLFDVKKRTPIKLESKLYQGFREFYKAVIYLVFGAGGQNRTDNLLITNELLCH